MEKVKIYLNEARSGFVVCQKCGKSKEINFSDGKVPGSCLVKCSCSNTFAVLFEKRQHYRKQLNICGTCFATGDSAEGASIKLVDISRGGIRFIRTDGKPLQLNEKIRVSFSLGDDTIFCSASVYNIRNECIGAKFISLDEHSKKVLGFFLLP
jgi:hypothetical protein